ncbi:hypothetical protein HFN46_33235 [Rhizobium leguminosarum]|nr:hypothetical protein [Rhizobium leguminosarum]
MALPMISSDVVPLAAELLCSLPFVAFALVGWWVLLAPSFRPSSGHPSFERVIALLPRILKLGGGSSISVDLTAPRPSKTKLEWRIQVMMTMLSVLTFIAVSYLLGDWLSVLLLAMVTPILGIASIRLASAQTAPSAERAESIILNVTGVAALALIVALGWVRTDANRERLAANSLRAAVSAFGIEGNGNDDLLRSLRLSIAAHKDNPIWLSAQSLRNDVDRLPTPAGRISASKVGPLGIDNEERLESVSASRTGAYVAGASGESVRIWKKGSNKEIIRFDCAGLRTPLLFSPEDSHIAAACSQGLLLWDIAGRKELFKQPSADLTMIRFAPESHYLATVEGTRCVNLFDVVALAKLASYCLDTPVVGMTFTRDGQYLAIARDSGTIRTDFVALKPPYISVTDVPASWQPVSASFAIISAAGVGIYDWGSSQPRMRIAAEAVTRAVVGAAGDRLMTVRNVADTGSEKIIDVWRLTDGQSIGSLACGSLAQIETNEAATAAVWRSESSDAQYWQIGDTAATVVTYNAGAVGLSADGTLLVSASTEDRNDIAAGTLWSVGGSDKSAASGVSYSKAAEIGLDQGSTKIVASFADHVLLLDPRNGSPITSTPAADAKQVSVSTNGSYMAIVTSKGDLTVWSISPGPPTKIDRDLPHADPLSVPLFAPDAAWLAVDTGQGEVRVLTIPGGNPIIRWPFAPKYCSQRSTSSDSKLLAVNDCKNITIFDIAKKQQTLSISVPQWQGEGSATIGFRPGSHQLVVAYAEKPASTQEAFAMLLGNPQRIAVWDVDQHRKLATFRQESSDQPHHIEFSRDGTRVALPVRPIEIWNLDRGKVQQTTIGEGTRSLAFSNDGRSLFTVSDRGTAHLWDIASGTEIDRLRATNLSTGMLLGSQAVTLSDSGEVRRWLIDPQALIAAGCARFDAASRPSDCIGIEP